MMNENTLQGDLSVKHMDGKTKAALFLAGFGVLVNLLAIFVALGGMSSATQNSKTISAISQIILFCLGVPVIVLILKGKRTLPAILGTLLVFVNSGIIQNILTTGNGYLYGLNMIAIGCAYSVLLLPKKSVSWGILGANFLGFLAVMFDFFGPDNRIIKTQGDTITVMAFVAVYALFAIIVIMSQWHNMDIRSKMLVSFIAAGTLVSIAGVIAIGTTRSDLVNRVHAVVAVGLLLAALFSLYIAQGIIEPLNHIIQGLESISKGELNWNIPERSKMSLHQRGDELGTAGRNLESTKVYLQDMAKSAHLIAEGNLKVRVTPISNQDEFGNAFALMVQKLKEIVKGITENAHQLSKASEQLAENATQAGQATRQIAITIQQVSQGSNRQTVSITQTASSVDQMGRAIDGVARGAQDQSLAINRVAEITNHISNSIRQVTANAEAGALGSEKASKVANGGAKTVTASILGMETIKNKVAQSSQKVQEMGNRSDQIGAIVQTIDDIASQTNLLALNAAIEAARAGEHGKGFAVVADEVRKLAEKSAIATKEIGSLIKGIQHTVNDAVAAMQEGSIEVEKGVIQANQAGQALDEILKAAEGVNRQVVEIASAAKEMEGLSNELISATDSVSAVVEENTAATEEMSAGSSEVSKLIDHITSVSEENNAAVEEVSASAEEMSAQVDEVSAYAKSLAAMAENLQHIIAQFQMM